MNAVNINIKRLKNYDANWPKTNSLDPPLKERDCASLLFKTEFEAGMATLSMDLMRFITDWFREHIMKTDRAYAPFFIKKGVD